MMGPSDAEQRFKRVAAPPPPVEVEREILERYAGNYVYERRSQVTEERTEADQWVALIAIGDDNQMSIDFDDQAILEIVPTSDTELHITGFDAFITMIVNPATGNAEQFELLQDGVLTTFDRQIGAED